jgi:hypothetical protein
MVINLNLRICSLATAKAPPVSLFSNLIADCSTVVKKSRHHSAQDYQFIASKVKRLLEEGIIEPSNSPWHAQAFAVKRDNHKTRMVIDHSQSKNRFAMLDTYPFPRIEEVIAHVSKYNILILSTTDLKSAYHQVPILESEKDYTAFVACGKVYHFLHVSFGVTNGMACFQRVIDKTVQDEGLESVSPYIDDVTVCGRSQLEHDHNLEKTPSCC